MNRRFCKATYGYDFGDDLDTRCFDTYNTTNNPIFTDTSLSNTADRQWAWSASSGSSRSVTQADSYLSM